jgi:hypothetical protein
MFAGQAIVRPGNERVVDKCGLLVATTTTTTTAAAATTYQQGAVLPLEAVESPGRVLCLVSLGHGRRERRLVQEARKLQQHRRKSAAVDLRAP